MSIDDSDHGQDDEGRAPRKNPKPGQATEDEGAAVVWDFEQCRGGQGEQSEKESVQRKRVALHHRVVEKGGLRGHQKAGDCLDIPMHDPLPHVRFIQALETLDILHGLRAE